MAEIYIDTYINSSPEIIWKSIQNIESHTDWMQDAEKIEFLTDFKEGTGTKFNCLTKVAFIKLNDKMEITEWETNKTMGVTHKGIVSGSGKFSLIPKNNGTMFSWQENLKYPWYMGGVVGETISKPILKRIWKKNLSNLKKKIETNF